MYWRKRELNYNILIPEIPERAKSLDDLTPQEAEEFFNWYIGKIPERVQYLSSYSGIALDYSVDSLVDIWAWFLGIVEIEKTPPARMSELKKDLGGMPRDMANEVLKEHARQPTLESMYIAKDIGMYDGEVSVRNNNALYWGYHTDVKKDSFANRPLVMGYEDRNFDPPWQYYDDPDFFVTGCAESASMGLAYPTQLLEGYEKMQKGVHNS